MPRPALTVNTSSVSKEARQPSLRPHQSVSSLSSMSQASIDEETKNAKQSAPPLSNYKPPQPSFWLLFSLFAKKDLFVLLLPAICAALAAASIPPFLTIVIGDAYDVFGAYQAVTNPTAEDHRLLLKGIGLASIEFCAISAGALVLSGVMSSLWIWVGEKNVMYIRRLVYDTVSSREMEWFDKNSSDDKAGGENVGAGGLMTQFASATEDVRIASSLNMGMMVQHTCTILATMIMGLQRSPLLAVVILSTIPLSAILTVFSQRFSFPHIMKEREESSATSSVVDRAINAISTVKAFNAQSWESQRANFNLERIRVTTGRLITVWAISQGIGNFTIFSMFVQGFWFGSKMVRDGKLSPGDVLSVFWACLIAASTTSAMVACMMTYSRGKIAMVTLMKLAHPDPSTVKPSTKTSMQPIVKTPKTPLFGGPTFLKPTALQKIRPPTCQGEFNISDLTFAYPSRPDVNVLSNVTLFLPAGEMTFILGGSGSGKSTLSQLLLRLYEPQEGSIELDSRSLNYLDEHWTRSHIAAVSQNTILFDGTVHENVALGIAGGFSGRHPRDVTREEVVAACRVALMHDFIRELPDGYDTKLGSGGASLSGGQKQRLSIARAYIRNPTVLILDEATSALDATSRLLVFEAVRHWRKKQTTIVITHDLSQIMSDDFVYVLSNGQLAEQGFRQDLEADQDGELHQMMVSQGLTGGYLPEKDTEAVEDEQAYERGIYIEATEDDHEYKEFIHRRQRSTLTQPLVPAGQSWAIEEEVNRLNVTGGRTTPMLYRPPSSMGHGRAPSSQGHHGPTTSTSHTMTHTFSRPRRASLTLETPAAGHKEAWRRSSLQITPTSSSYTDSMVDEQGIIEDDEEFNKEKEYMERAAEDVRRNRRRVNSSRKRWDTQPETESPSKQNKKLHRLKGGRSKSGAKTGGKDEEPTTPIVTSNADSIAQIPFFKLMRLYWPTIPQKPIYILGLIFALISGAATPVFGFFLSRLVVEITGATYDSSTLNRYGVYVLLLAILNGVSTGIKYYLIEYVTAKWLRDLRQEAFAAIVRQDKSWFDKPINTPSQLLQLVMRDPEDARAFLALVIPQGLVVSSMIGTGLIWALAVGWQLTLVGLALGPLFVFFSSVQNHFAGKFERRNKTKREEVNGKYYDTVANVRAIRAMGFEAVFKEQFERTLENAMKAGVNGGFVDGLSYGIANALIYGAQGLIFYVGAVLMAKGLYTFLQTIQVLNLVSFSLAIGAQLLYFVQRINKSLQSLRDFVRLLSLRADNTEESQGKHKFRVQGAIRFHSVSFAYPTRPDVTVLKDLNFKIKPDECVALVGSSGSGKSTIAALLQRLYEPTAGFISVNGHRLHNSDVTWVRDHMAVVSQHPYLFDATIEENIGYGGSTIFPRSEIERAAKEANIHDFIMSLPNGYDTYVGENASLISGGQAQRISIARALVRPSKLLILDEATSALDPETQREVMNTIQRVKNGRTTIVVSHKLPMMKMADRIIVLSEGTIVEEGSYDELMKRHGVFYGLANAGEWEGANE